jgi:hypothetical protein
MKNARFRRFFLSDGGDNRNPAHRGIALLNLTFKGDGHWPRRLATYAEEKNGPRSRDDLAAQTGAAFTP